MNSPRNKVSLLRSRWWRRLAKIPIFLAQTRSWPLACWLARHDAALHLDFRGIQLDDLIAAWDAVGRWGEEIVISEGRVRSRTLDLPFRSGSIQAAGFGTLRLLAERGFRVTESGASLQLAGHNLVLRINKLEEIEMLREILLEGSYALTLPGAWVVFDVGANVGYAALAFATQPWLHQVLMYEPFEETANGLLANRELNPILAQKLTLHRFAWSDREATTTVHYHRERSGSMRIDGGSFGGPVASEGVPATVEVRCASAEFLKHLPKCAGRSVLVKLDCEGSEYPILRDLEQSGSLARIDAFLIEWHYQSPDELIARLSRAGFCIQIRPVKESYQQGLILAWRQATRT